MTSSSSAGATRKALDLISSIAFDEIDGTIGIKVANIASPHPTVTDSSQGINAGDEATRCVAINQTLKR
jgi:hypothetical protein